MKRVRGVGNCFVYCVDIHKEIPVGTRVDDLYSQHKIVFIRYQLTSVLHCTSSSSTV